MNWNSVLTSLVTVIGLGAPAITYHHFKIRSIIRTITEVAEALNGGPVSPGK